jgi:hypothetical protein
MQSDAVLLHVHNVTLCVVSSTFGITFCYEERYSVTLLLQLTRACPRAKSTEPYADYMVHSMGLRSLQWAADAWQFIASSYRSASSVHSNLVCRIATSHVRQCQLGVSLIGSDISTKM